MDLVEVFGAWVKLLHAASAFTDVPETLNYDVVNVGREVLVQLVGEVEHNITQAVAKGQKDYAISQGEFLMELLMDLDELLGCDVSFLLGRWIADAVRWSAPDAQEAYYQFQARSQVSTWWPVTDNDINQYQFGNTSTYDNWPVLINYAKKQWNE